MARARRTTASTTAPDTGGATGSSSTATTASSISIGTTDVVTALDPAGSYDNGSLLVEDNIYQFLMSVPAGETAPKPDAAEKCEFTQPTEYTCTLKDGQKFSNGDDLTAEDVAFSFKRVITINDPNGPASLLGNMKSVAAKDDKTVVFTLNNPNDQTFPFVLGTSAGPIVDSKVFPADKLLDDTKVIGSGPYAIDTYSKNQQVQFKANPNYGGDNVPKTDSINLVYYTESTNMKLDVQSGDIDVAWRSLTPTDVESLKSDDGVKVLTGSGGELRYLVFNLKTMPGDTDAQKLAVRKAIAYSVDRKDLADNVFQGTYQPAYSIIPQGIADATEPFKDAYGESPDKAKAAQMLTTPASRRRCRSTSTTRRTTTGRPRRTSTTRSSVSSRTPACSRSPSRASRTRPTARSGSRTRTRSTSSVGSRTSWTATTTSRRSSGTTTSSRTTTATGRRPADGRATRTACCRC